MKAAHSFETHYQITWVHIAEYSNLHNQTWEPQNSKGILWTKLHWKCSNYKIFIIFQKYITALHYQSLFNDDSLQAGQSGDWNTVKQDFPHPSRTILGPTKPPMQWAPHLIPRLKVAGAVNNHPTSPSTKVKRKKSRAITLPPTVPSRQATGWTLPSTSLSTV